MAGGARLGGRVFCQQQLLRRQRVPLLVLGRQHSQVRVEAGHGCLPWPPVVTSP